MMPPQEGYVFALDATKIKRYFPNLIQGKNFEFTSGQTDEYNCVAWATELTADWVQFIYDEIGNYDNNVQKYIKYFTELGFIKTENSQFVKDVQKIAIYANENKDFVHVARQLNNGKWTSKLGEWEDIEHTTLEVLAGDSYGNPYIIMEKKNEI